MLLVTIIAARIFSWHLSVMKMTQKNEFGKKMKFAIFLA